MLIDADLRWFMLIDTDWCRLMLIDADWCRLMLIDADWCWLMLKKGSNKVFFVGAYLQSFSGHFSFVGAGDVHCNMLRIQFSVNTASLQMIFATFTTKKIPFYSGWYFLWKYNPFLLYLWQSVSNRSSVFVIDLSFALTFAIGGIFPGRGSFSYNRSSPRYDVP